MQQILATPDEELVSVLQTVDDRQKSKDDLFHWADVIDRFDDLLANCNVNAAPTPGLLSIYVPDPQVFFALLALARALFPFYLTVRRPSGKAWTRKSCA